MTNEREKRNRYYKYIVKRHLNDIREHIGLSTNEMERSYYNTRYAAQLSIYAEALGIRIAAKDAEGIQMALRFFGKLPSAIGWGAIPDGQGSGGTAPREPPHLAGIPQQQDIAFYPAGRKGALSGIGTARSVGSKL